MNTRIQVEHPITELVTGLDIVELMINSAEGKVLPLTQDDVKLQGWALETRICAEDPSTYLPFAGVLKRYIEPDIKSPRGVVRCDSGVEQGSEISVFYDSLICKVSTHSSTREGAIELMKDALDSFAIEGIARLDTGVVNNISLLRNVLENDKFVNGNLNTGFLKQEYPEGFQGWLLTDDSRAELVSIAAAVYLMTGKMKGDIFDEECFLSINDGEFYSIKFQELGNGQFLINGNMKTTLDDWSFGNSLVNANVNGTRRIVQISNPKPLGFSLRYIGSLVSLQINRSTISKSKPHFNTTSINQIH